MGKGAGKTGKKRSHYEFKKRCCGVGCKKRARHKSGGEFFCRKCWKIENE